MGVPMDLDFNLLETGSLFLAILVTSFTLQVIYVSVSQPRAAESTSVQFGVSGIVVNIVVLATNTVKELFVCCAGRVVALSEGTAAPPLLRCDRRVLFCPETAFR